MDSYADGSMKWQIKTLKQKLNVMEATIAECPIKGKTIKAGRQLALLLVERIDIFIHMYNAL